MIRRLTSGPEAGVRVAAMTCSALGSPSGVTRSPYRIASNFARLEDASDGRMR